MNRVIPFVSEAARSGPTASGRNPRILALTHERWGR